MARNSGKNCGATGAACSGVGQAHSVAHRRSEELQVDLPRPSELNRKPSISTGRCHPCTWAAGRRWPRSSSWMCKHPSMPEIAASDDEHTALRCCRHCERQGPFQGRCGAGHAAPASEPAAGCILASPSRRPRAPTTRILRHRCSTMPQLPHARFASRNATETQRCVQP